MSSKFEQLLDYLVNEETEKANELFHEIVVEKSRDIYESLIAEEEDEEMDETREEDEDESVDEATDCDEEEETTESIFGEEEEEFPVQDKTDDFGDDTEADLGDDDMGGEMDDDSSAPADKGDIQDLEDALEELKAEFEALMAAEKHEEEENPDVHGGELDGIGDEEESEEEEEEEAFESSEEDEEESVKESRVARTQGEKMREYIEKVTATMVDGEGVGSGRGDKAGQTGHDAGKSPISSGSGKPTSGANAKNVAQAGKGANEDGTSPKGKVGGLVKTGGDFVKAGTKNVASSANAKKPDGSKLTSVSKPSNKEFAGVGAVTGGDKAGQTGSGDTTSPLNGAPNRAK